MDSDMISKVGGGPPTDFARSVNLYGRAKSESWFSIKDGDVALESLKLTPL